MIDPDSSPDQFLYGRKGPWPQPSPSHPLKEANEVLNIPPIEAMLWNGSVGLRLLKSQIGYTGAAAMQAVADLEWPIPTDAQFNQMMCTTAYTRFMKPAEFKGTWVSDFSAMKLVRPLQGLYCAPVACGFEEDEKGNRFCSGIVFRGETPAQDRRIDSRGPLADWNLAKIFALQAAAYHMLFVVHPALHFPMDSVNAITKTTVPHTHPLFQLLYPHTSYTLALDNAVLEGPESVVNTNAQGTWFDPLMGDAANLKLLFGAGYAGLDDPWYRGAYPPYDYMNPQMGFDSPYGTWLQAYFRPFRALCTTVATEIFAADKELQYVPFVQNWARWNSVYVKGFPDEKQILDRDCLAQAMAIFLWDVTVSHGGDHYSFGRNIPAPYKFLRIRHAPPTTPPSGEITKVGQVSCGDDLYRSEMAQEMFFGPHGMPPNLQNTWYPFLTPALAAAQEKFHGNLLELSGQFTYSKETPFMPLTPEQAIGAGIEKDSAYAYTIPASIQY